MPVDAETFRRAMANFASGVTVVTTSGAGGRPYGLTATAFSSVSLRPPLVLVCVGHESETHPHFRTHGVFAVHFLREDQQDLSARFATSGGDKFQGLDWRSGLTGAPVLTGVLACLECRLVDTHEAGDHTILIGQVEEATAPEGRPLLYFRGRYRKLAPEQ